MKKKYDLRELYVCATAKQTQVETGVENGVLKKSWKYVEKPYNRIMLKSLCGFKHILTGVTYQVASQKTAGKIVIIRNSLQEFAKQFPELVMATYKKYGTYKVYIEAIEVIEDLLNENLQEQIEEKGI